MDLSKIHLSQEELELVLNAEWLLTKNRIIEKVYHLFGSLVHDVKENFGDVMKILPDEIMNNAAKISKGENYKGLPYVMLDYPRGFGKKETFAIRTMFWWGNFFSTTLQLKGKYKSSMMANIQKNIQHLSEGDFYINISNDEWRHDFEPDNYIAVKNANEKMLSNILADKHYCKLACKVSLKDWNQAGNILLNNYRVIFTVLELSSPNGEKDLSPGSPKAGFDL